MRVEVLVSGSWDGHRALLVADLGAQRSLGSHLPTGVSTLRRDPACFAVLCVAVDAIAVRGDPLWASFSRQTGTGRDDSCRQSQHQDRRREEINSPQVLTVLVSFRPGHHVRFAGPF